MKANKLAIKLLKFYQKAISPYLPHACRYVPTCSEYAQAAFEKYGFFRASLKSLLRLLRCHPFSKGGLDYLK